MSELHERPKIEHIVKKSSIDFFKLINDLLTSKLKQQVDQSPSAKLIKSVLQQEIDEGHIGNQSYKSLFGESNPKRTAADAYEY